MTSKKSLENIEYSHKPSEIISPIGMPNPYSAVVGFGLPEQWVLAAYVNESQRKGEWAIKNLDGLQDKSQMAVLKSREIQSAVTNRPQIFQIEKRTEDGRDMRDYAITNNAVKALFDLYPSR